jgi:hypothetical protein
MRYPNIARVGLLLAFYFGQLLYAQLDTGAVSGTVRDSSGAILQAATVKIVETETGIVTSLLSNADGFFSAPSLRVGKYNISASAAGFATETRTGIYLRVQDRLNVDFSLSPGQTNTVVTVGEALHCSRRKTRRWARSWMTQPCRTCP